MKYPVYLIIVLLTMSPPIHADSGSAGGGFAQQQPMKRLTPEEKALVSYQRGLKHRDKAAKFEQKAVDEKNEKKHVKLQKKTAKEYQKAIDDYEKAIGYYPMLYQAHSSLGYALRNVNRFEESLAAYNQSLEINPFYYEAIEYRGEAYLGLNRLDDAKAAYMELFQDNRPLADQLMAAMIAWVAARHDDTGGLDASVVDEFAEWVDLRNTLTSYIHPIDDTAGNHWSGSE
jgi:tetratricopeptide (TPR) repeat protein